MKCGECGTLLELSERPALRGESGGIELEILGVKARACPQADHPFFLVYPEFPADLLAALLLDGGLPTPSRTGLLRKRVSCFSCGEPLEGAPEAESELRCRVWVKRVSPCTVTYRGPTARCKACSKPQLPPSGEVETELERALLGALARDGFSS